jgi:hypothetical protein
MFRNVILLWFVFLNYFKILMLKINFLYIKKYFLLYFQINSQNNIFFDKKHRYTTNPAIESYLNFDQKKSTFVE